MSTLSLWVLILFGAHFSTAVDMPSKAACEAAKAQVYQVEGSWISYACVYRGEPVEQPK